MTALSNRKTSIVAFVLLYVAYCISYIDRAAISLAATIDAAEPKLAPRPA